MLYFRSLACWLLVAVFAITANARPGDFDLAFGTGGKTITSLARYAGGFDSAQAAIVQGDGRILVAEICEDGSRYRTCIARFDSTGNTDTMFGQNGVTRLGMLNLNLSMPAHLIPDGEGTIIAASCPDREGSCLFRLTASGALDSAFGTNGVALSTTHRRIYALAWQGSALLAAGRCMSATSFASALCLWRYLPNGTPDTSFGDQGVLVPAIPIVQYDRFETDLAVVGQSILLGTTCVADTMTPPVFCVARFDVNGLTDSNFGVTGIARVAVLEGYHRFNKLVVAPQAMYAAGTCTTRESQSIELFCIARLDFNGVPDSSFGIEGKVSSAVAGAGLSSQVVGAYLSNDGLLIGGFCAAAGPYDRIICAVRYGAGGSLDATYGNLGIASITGQKPVMAVGTADSSMLLVSECTSANGAGLCLTRLTPGGAPDAAFGVGGVKSHSIGTRIANEWPSLIAASAGGKFLSAGNCSNPGGTSVPCIARFMPNGDLDLSLASAGYFLLPAGAVTSSIEGVADDNGKTLVVMRCSAPATGAGTPCVFRYLENGMLDTAFGSGGFVELSGVIAGTKTVIQGGKLVVAGACLGTTNSICVTKLNMDGTPETTFGVNGQSQFTVTMKSARVAAILADGTSIMVLSVCNDCALLFVFPASVAGLTRILMDGGIDLTYGNGGHVSSYPYVFTGPINADKDENQLIVMGTCGFTGNSCLYRILPSGTLDDAFGVNGQVLVPGNFANAILSRGRIIVTFRCASSGIAAICHRAYLPSGQVDVSFGASGQLQYAIGNGAATPAAGLLVGEKLVTAGFCKDGPATNPVDSFCHSAITLAAVAPQQPVLLKATPGAGNAFFDFSPPIDDGGSSISTYTLSCSPGSPSASGMVSPIALAGLTNDQTYTCTLNATNAAGSSAASNTLTVTPSANAIELLAIGSRKTHAGSGDFTLPVTLRPSVLSPMTIEPRVGDGFHDFLLSFTQSVATVASMAASDAQSGTYQISTISNVGTTMVVRVAGIPDRKRLTLQLLGINGTLDVTVPVGVFIADVNGSGGINAVDIVAIKRNASLNVNEQNFRFDINRSGAIGADDVSIVKSRSGQRLDP